jgi:transcriptional regulator with XRE-family HTH domain
MHTKGISPGSGGAADIGHAIRVERRRRDMTQEELALETGLQRKTIYQVEHGKSDPRLGTLRRIADAMDVRVVDLLGGSRPRA